MLTNTFVLYLSTVLIWGSTFIAIPLQLGEVPGDVSIAYRFGLAALVLMFWCRMTRRNMVFGFRQHLWMAGQGLMLFGFNYMLVYQASADITSGLIAVVFSTIIVMNIVNGALFFGNRVPRAVIAGAALGLAGICLVFLPEVRALDADGATLRAIILSLVGTFITSFGNMISARNQSSKLPVMQSNAYGMAYAALVLALIAWGRGEPFVFEASWTYAGALVYLALVGSVMGFGSFLTLLGRIGPERAAYCMVLFPIVALALSTVFENYHWTPEAMAGVSLVLAGNLLVIVPKQQFLRIVRIFRPAIARQTLKK
ncbi:DMT family transporter [Marinobacter sp. ANT_B65]|uniref:DMT family transporter n=1 Tax=Marinobacter sp. ANT_B65 TaxID=2039467 RepID=UPI000BBEB23E|nr:EamA family transporter [Marinobacter sp. ANT_B65]PCM43603.1 EamA family transporter [Marinobacter sp. ANT_B65]